MPKIKKVVKAKKENVELEDEELEEVEPVENEGDDEEGDEDENEEVVEHAKKLKTKVKKVKKISKAKAENIIGEIDDAEADGDEDRLSRLEKKIDDFIEEFRAGKKSEEPAEEDEAEELETQPPAPKKERGMFYWE